MGISTSRLCDRRAYRGRIDGEYRMRAPSVASRSRTRGWRTATGPMPVMISRSGRWPWRTTRCWPVSVLRSVCFARNSATSASTAWVSNARAPLRRISVRESVKAPGWASLMTLLSDTAYHSFIGEVEALNTTTIRRLTRSRRHQLLAIALGKPFQDTFQSGDHLRKLVQRPATVELSRVMGNDLDAKDAFALGIDLQSQLAAVQLEDRQIIRRSLNRDFPFGRALCSPAIFRTMLVSGSAAGRVRGRSPVRS